MDATGDNFGLLTSGPVMDATGDNFGLLTSGENHTLF